MTPIHRYWTAAELDVQLSARGTVADIGPFVAEYARLTAEARAGLPCTLAIPYGPTEPERLDVFPARAGTGPAPVFVYVHGGYWRALDAADSGFMAETLTAAGACVVVVNYALAPTVSMDEIVRQCRAALVWIHRTIAAHGGDPARIHVAGSSAGGHLAAAMAASGWATGAGLPDPPVAGATLLSGLFDLAPVQMGEPNGWLRMDPDEARRNSPLHALPVAPIPLVVSYAPNETDEFKRQSEIYMAAAAAIGFPVRFVPCPGTNHFDIVLDLARPDSALTRAVRDTMGL
jgi:arylformamidase